MFKNLLLISLRSLTKRKFYSILNIVGLALSIAFSLLLWIYVQDQTSYDKKFSQADRIYRVNADLDMNGKHDIYSNAPMPVAYTFKDEFPEIVETTRLAGVGGLEIHTAVLEYEGRKVESNRIFAADSTVFSIFERDFLQGDPEQALKEPNSLVLTESLAKNIFGTSDAIGKTTTLIIDGKLLKVTGVVKDDLRNTHLPVDAYVSWSTRIPRDYPDQWYGGHVYTYILLNEQNDVKALNEKIPAYYGKYMKSTFDEFHGKADLHFQSLLSIYLDPELTWEAYPHGSRTNVDALSIVIILLLVFACINYVNLSTAFAADRAGEVGIRKVLGSGQSKLVAQFLSEAVLLALTSGAVALLASWLLLPQFTLLSGINADEVPLFGTNSLILLAVICITIGVLAGLYPSFYLSSLRPMESIKGKFSSGKKGEALRQILVVSQYVIAAVLIACIFLVGQQTNFIKNKDIGYNKNGVLDVAIPEDTTVLFSIPAFIEKLKANTSIAGATSLAFQIDKEGNHFSPTLQNPDGTTFQTGVDFNGIDADFVSTMEVEMVLGRTFQPGSEADLKTFMINEAAMKAFGWQENTLDARFLSWTSRMGDGDQLDLIGVVKDFNMGVSYAPVNPTILFLVPNGGMSLYVRVKEDATLEGVAATKAMWEETFPTYPFEFTFLDQTLNVLYEKEDKFLKMLSIFSIVILVIASLGIIGLISFTVFLKRKEIAVRKVLGSGVRGLVTILSKRFVLLILLAFVLAVPATIYLMGMWLEGFTYRVDIGVWPFAISLATCLSFTVLSLSYHIFKAVFENPVLALRSE
ncbi:MAG: ABC transporter permease [Cyclobacteriaceae bacterium]